MWVKLKMCGCSVVWLAAVLFATVYAKADDDTVGPIFVKEPPNRIDFSNTTGAVVECRARGSPAPDLIWVRTDGSAVGDVPGLRQILPNGNLVFPPFRAEDYRQEVHAQVYICLARNSVGSIHSKDVNVRAAVNQYYEAQVYDLFVIRGNAAVFKCHVPSFVSDHVEIISWHDTAGGEYPYSATEYDGKYLVLPSGELHIRDVGPEDGYKSYQCRTRHRLTGETRLSATKGRLVITEPVSGTSPKVPTSVKSWNTVSLENQGLAMLCPAQAFPAPSFRWYKFIEGSSRKQPVTLDDRVKQVSGTLIIKEALVEDSGKYLCVVNNSVGGESVETVLTVTAPLKTTIEPATQTVDFGRPALFTCRIEGNPIKTINWLKDGKDINHHDPILRIESVKKEDKGMYQCFIRNDQESAGASAELKLGGRFEPPQIRHSFAEQTMHPGPAVVLKCIASGNPTPELSWELDGKRLTNTERFQVGQYVTVDGNVVSHLNISSIHTNDGGLYKCIATSKVGSASHSGRVNVYGLPFVRPMDKHSIVASETLIVNCPVAGYPIESIVWERDGRVLPINRKQKVFPNGTLVIENVERMSDQATYTCVAKNAQGYTDRKTLEVNVMVAPQITPFNFGDETLNAGDTVSLTCTVNKGDLPLNINWNLNNKNITQNDGVTISRSGKRISVLSIDSVQAICIGNYSCIATNAAGKAVHYAYLYVNVAPQIMPFNFGEEPVNAGEMTSAYCSVNKGDMPLQIEWYLNENKIINQKNGIIFTRTTNRISVLSIESIRAEHGGSFTCVATNKAGTTNHTSMLIVNVAPQIMPFSFGEEPANAGEMTTIQCAVNKGDLPLQIEWYLNGVKIASQNNGITFSRTTKRISALNIESIRAENGGTFTCVAVNKAGTTNHTSVLIVNVAPQIMPFSFGEEPANAGEMTIIQCAVNKGDLPLQIEWYLNGNMITTRNSGISFSRTTSRISTLSIESIRAEHGGSFTCVSSNKAGTANHTSVLIVNVAPQIMPFSFGEEPANAGEMTIIQCAVSKGDFPLQIDWYSNGVKLDKQNNGITINRMSNRVSALSIESIKAEHGSSYMCVAGNKAGITNYTSVLIVNVAPQIMPFSFGEEPANAGEMTTIQCAVNKGDFPLEINWYLNGVRIASQNNGITFSRTTSRISTLSIESIRAEHGGTFTCVAINKAGTTNHTSVLIVNGTF